jgi:hypothetical protein
MVAYVIGALRVRAARHPVARRFPSLLLSLLLLLSLHQLLTLPLHACDPRRD